MTPNHIQMLRTIADEMMRVDGDRDHMNKSDLTVEQSLACAEALRVCADEFESLNFTQQFQRSSTEGRR